MNSDQVARDIPSPAVARWVLSAALAGFVALGASAMVSAVLYGSDAKAAFDRRTAEEIVQENQGACSKLGVTVGTPAAAACAHQMNDVRRLHDERRVRNDMF